jgi:hypothetical protein
MDDQNAGSATTQTNSVPPEPNQSNDKVAYETYKRVLSEAKKLKEQVKAFEENQAKLQEQTLKEQQQWKSLYEQREKELAETKKVLSEKELSIINGNKLSAFEKHLGGRIKKDEYMPHVPWDKIVINPESGRVDEESVKGAVAEFTKEYSELVEFQTARMPNAAPKAFSTEISIENLKTKSDIKNAFAAALTKK